MPRTIEKKEILEFLRANPIMEIAVYDGEKPISSVLLFYVDDDFNFYFGTKVSTHKAKALIEHPEVGISVWAHHQMLVQADGIATRISVNFDDILNKIIESTINIADFWPPILHTEEDEYVIFRIRPSWLRIMDISNPNISSTENPFQIIINDHE